jgi:GNAT superfamily N-acetyltransferase
MHLERLSQKNIGRMTRIVLACFSRAYFDKEIKFWYNTRLRGNRLHNDVLEYYFAILKTERGKGLGSKMLKETITKAKIHGCSKFGAWTNIKRAAKFYEKNGFKKGKKQVVIIVDRKIVYRYPRNSVFYYKKC